MSQIQQISIMNNLDHPALCADLSAMPWKTLLQNLPDVNTMVRIFNQKFLEPWNKHCPIKSRRVRKHKTPWMNPAILQLSQKCDVGYKYYLYSKNDETYRNYKILRNVVTDDVRKSKREFFMQGARSEEKYFWANVKHQFRPYKEFSYTLAMS